MFSETDGLWTHNRSPARIPPSRVRSNGPVSRSLAIRTERRDSLVRPASFFQSRPRLVGTAVVLAVTLLSLVELPRPVAAAPIEAVRGKRYRITTRHGPWMIFVASLHGNTARGAADSLVYELRKLGIPAYTFSQAERTAGVRGNRPGRRPSTLPSSAISPRLSRPRSTACAKRAARTTPAGPPSSAIPRSSGPASQRSWNAADHRRFTQI